MGINEEVVFRGAMLGGFQVHKNKVSFLNILFIALIFSLAHFINLVNSSLQDAVNTVVYAFTGGVLLCTIALHSPNVWLLGIFHGLLNFMAEKDIAELYKYKEQLSKMGVQNKFNFNCKTSCTMFLIMSPLILVGYLLHKNYLEGYKQQS
jgi:membrane protease YdiL (CAAX protease family)